MGTDIRSLPGQFTSDATFRAWGGGISAQLAAAGLTKASDSGQVDWATVAMPPTLNTVAGYEVWRFSDALQATRPVFIKLEYGSSGVLNAFRLGVTLSTGTDGAGVPTGQVSPQRLINLAVKSGLLSSYCSCSSNRLSLCMHLDPAVFAAVLLIERTKNSDGTNTGDAIVCLNTTGANSMVFGISPFTGVIPTTQSWNPCLDLNAGGFASGPDILLSPTMCFYGKLFFVLWSAIRTIDLTPLTVFSMTHLGAIHSFITLATVIPTNIVANGATGYGLVMPWE